MLAAGGAKKLPHGDISHWQFDGFGHGPTNTSKMYVYMKWTYHFLGLPTRGRDGMSLKFEASVSKYNCCISPVRIGIVLDMPGQFLGEPLRAATRIEYYVSEDFGYCTPNCTHQHRDYSRVIPGGLARQPW